MEGWIMGDIRTSALGGIPFGDSNGRPLYAGTGQPYFNGEVGRLELFTSDTGWQNIVQETPGVASVVGTYLESAGSGTITISGTNFVSGCYATAIGSNGVQVDATSTVFNSIVQVSATFTGLSAEFEPYDIKVTNPSNLFGMIPDALYINQSPVWTTSAGSLGSALERDLVAFQVSASDPEGGAITYSSSNLPLWLSVGSSSGIISGTAPSVDSNTTYNFSINASDGANTVVSRSFSITINALSTVELLLVGGGGGGGSTISGHHEAAGGGGAGGLYYNATMPITGSHLVTVGAGGTGGVGSAGENGYPGQNSVFGTKIGLGGGAGGGQYANGQNNGINGGSGGGWCGHAGFGRSTNTGLQSSSETGGLGNAGGQATAGGAYGGGGGGGAGGAGSNNNGRSGGSGGAGVQYSITGTSLFYAAGGGGGAQSDSSGGGGGSGIGGNGSSSGGSAGASNTGSGGGASGASGQQTGGSGGSGVVIFAVPGNHTAQNIPGTLTYVRDTTTRAGHTVYKFTAGTGTITL
jgi:mucin-19